ncbi:MAG TPA: prolyl oligopeptidase family serine peptidase, partial [Pyrinomonadaceae bacterium]|nr:prolyl oligopeptidase family serine peptidase [Pyrinomonadaceae bacterium]
MRNLPRLLLVSILLAATALAQDGDIAPGDNLIVQGVPKIPATLAETVRRYTEFRTAALTDWHPTRREMLISTRFGDTAQAHLVRQPLGARRQLTFYPERVGGATFRPKRGDYFVFSKDIGGNEFFQYYRQDAAGTGEAALLTDGKSRNTSWRWSNSGERAAYSSTRRNGRDTDIYVVNPQDPQTTRLLLQVEGGGWGVADWSPDDARLLVEEFLSANESKLWLVEAATGAKTLFSPEGVGKVAYGGARFSRDGRGVYLTTDRDAEFQRLAYVDLATKRFEYLTDHIKWDVTSFEVSPDGSLIAFVTNEDGIGRLRLLDTRARRERTAPELPTGIVGGLAWHESGRELGFNFTSARTPSDVYSLDVRTGKVERWTESETGGIDTGALAEPELVRWPSFDGRQMSGFLYRPPARFTGKRPVVVNIHGGPEGQARPTFLGRNNYFLNEQGVAIIYPNVRGSSGYGKTFLALDNGVKREDTYKDIAALLDWIKTRPD